MSNNTYTAHLQDDQGTVLLRTSSESGHGGG